MTKKVSFLAIVAAAALLATGSVPASPKGPLVPADIAMEVAPGRVSAGGTLQVTLRLTPVDGVQINRYPTVSLTVPEAEGLTPGARVSVGSATPPPLDKMDKNYFDEVDPLRLELPVLAAAPDGKHEIGGKLTYTYCVKASGFCSRKRVAVSIPLSVH